MPNMPDIFFSIRFIGWWPVQCMRSKFYACWRDGPSTKTTDGKLMGSWLGSLNKRQTDTHTHLHTWFIVCYQLTEWTYRHNPWISLFPGERKQYSLFLQTNPARVPCKNLPRYSMYGIFMNIHLATNDPNANKCHITCHWCCKLHKVHFRIWSIFLQETRHQSPPAALALRQWNPGVSSTWLAWSIHEICR